MTEKQYETALLALGAKDVTTNRQKMNGTTCFELPTGDTVAEFKSGYIRKYLTYKGKKLTCYQLNPTYEAPHKTIWSDGRYMEWTHTKRMLIHSRKTRLKKLFLYTIKQINNARA
tara:strand:- start:315 stop:659 length:345 start_codon:yes stop_codon:yes gene_type:complete